MSAALRTACAASVAAVILLCPRVTRAYTVLGYAWFQPSMRYVVNPANKDLPQAAVITALQTAANVWRQSGSAFLFTYAGPTTQATTTEDGVNLVLFREATSGSALATTYTWYSGSNIIDADVVFWDAGFEFFTGSTGCSNGFYVEDVAAHEFGHALGLGHSTVPTATMYPTIAPCDEQNRTLDPDDIAAVLSIYPGVAARPAPPSGLRIVKFGA